MPVALTGRWVSLGRKIVEKLKSRSRHLRLDYNQGRGASKTKRVPFKGCRLVLVPLVFPNSVADLNYFFSNVWL